MLLPAEQTRRVGAQPSMPAFLQQRTTANVLRVAGLPAPIHGLVTAESDAISAAKKIGYPVVIKPSDRDRGEGVTVDVSDEAGLQLAFAHAKESSRSKQVIVERQVAGVCHRLFVANDKLLYAVKRHPMSVTGDAQHTIQELVDAEVANQANKPTSHLGFAQKSNPSMTWR